MRTVTWMLISAAIGFAQTPQIDEIVARMMNRDQIRQATVGSYSWTSTYVLDNKDRHAEMQVRWTRSSVGIKRFEVISEKGDGAVRDHVFHKLLESEVEASQPALQERNRLNARNYLFELAGAEVINGRPAYILEITPKVEAKYLTRGRVWVDAEDYAVVKAEGRPSKKPSFWTNSVIYVQTYEKTGEFWMAASNRSVTEAKIFGKADLVIQHFDYQFHGE
jgi:hypothetical protein